MTILRGVFCPSVNATLGRKIGCVRYFFLHICFFPYLIVTIYSAFNTHLDLQRWNGIVEEQAKTVLTKC